MTNVELKQYWDSQNCLERISSYSPDILLLDHYMPPIKGLDVLRKLLASEIDRPVTIIAMSSASMANNAMLKIGADIGIVKFELATLDVWNTHS